LARSTWLSWGVLTWRKVKPITSSGVRAKTRRKLNHEGAKSAWSNSDGAVPNVKNHTLGKGTLLVSCPRNHRRMLVETMLDREIETWSVGVEVGPPSDVTIRVKSSLIREGALLPPVVRRCLGGNQVFQTQGTGRVASVGAAGLERGSRARLLQGSGKLVSVRGWNQTLSGRPSAVRWHRAVRTTKERTVKPTSTMSITG
jgi:hypothetical protein